MPRLRADRVSRPRVRALLGRPADLAVVVAPAGFGKTTAVIDWILSEGRSFTWMAVRPGDEDRQVFAARFAESLEPLVGRGRGHGLTGSAGDWSASLYAAAIAEDLQAIDGPTVLVLEDLHHVANPSVHELIRLVAGSLPDDVMLLITSRSDPVLPLGSLRATGRLTEVRASDLAFDDVESAELLSRLIDDDINPDLVARLNERIEGWAVGLQLAGLSLVRRHDAEAFVDEFAGDDRYIAEYLLEEVLGREPQDVQAFLLETSVLEELSAGLCAAVTGQVGAGAMLEDLHRRNVFLVALDDKGHSYRYHHLLSDLLRSRLEADQPGRLREVLASAAVWCEQHAAPIDALRYLVQADDLEGAVELCKRHVSSLLIYGRLAELLAWVRTLPAAFVERDSELLLGRAWCSLFTGQPSDALRDLQQVEVLAPELVGQVEIMRSMAAWNMDDAEGSLQHAASGLSLLPDDNRMLPSLGHLYLGRGLLAQDHAEEALVEFDRAASLGEAAGNHFVALTARLGHAASSMHRGDLDDARLQLLEAVDTSEARVAAGADFPVGGAARIGLGVVAFERMELDEAVAWLRGGLQDLRRTAALDYTLLGYRRWSEAESMRGRHDDAESVLDEAASHFEAVGSGGPAFARALADCRVRNLLRLGDVERAWVFSREIADGQAAGRSDMAHPEFDHLATKVRLDVARGAVGEAVAALADLHALSGRNVGLQVKALTLEAVVRLTDEDRPGAYAAVALALPMAAPSRWLRPFVDAGRPLAELFESPASDPSERSLIERIRATQVPKARVERRQPIADPLTPRELEVLDEIAAGLTNAQIADRLFISVGTAKRHVANIFLKLAAGHRTEAVARARRLGILG